MKAILQSLILTLTLSIVACNNNPTNVESNPTKDSNYKAKTENIPGKVDPNGPCSDSYTFAITTQDGQPADPDNLPFTVGQLTTYRITVTSKLPNFRLKAVSEATNANLVETKTAGLWNLTLKPTEPQGNKKIRLAVVLPVPKDKVCVDGVAREALTLNVGFGKPRPAINVLDFDQNKLYQSSSTQGFQVEVNDPNISENEAAKVPTFDFRSLYQTVSPDGTPETLFLSAQNAVTCDPNGSKVAAQTFRFNCSINFPKVQSIPSGEIFGHSDFLIYGVSVSGDKSVGESIGFSIQHPGSQPPFVAPKQKGTTTPSPKEQKKDKKSDLKKDLKKDSKKSSSKDSTNDSKKDASSKDSTKTSGDKT